MSSVAETNKILKAIIVAWLVFCAALVVYFGADHLLRLRAGDFCQPGLPGWAYYILVGVFAVAAVLCFRKVPSVYPVWQRLLMSLICVGLCYTSYVLAALTYVLFFANCTS